MSATARPKPLILAILDGWGHRHETADNAIAQARTPVLDGLIRDYPNGLINASELHVGLPEGQMGNSEVGHMNIGSGRVCMQDLPRIDAAIESGELSQKLNQHLPTIKGAVHLLGLLSDGGVHSHQAHIAALAKTLSAAGKTVYIHAFLDGRDTPPRSAKEYVAWLEQQIAGLKNVTLATLCGRYYAMDRDKRWDRVQKAYNLLTRGEGSQHSSAQSAIDASYAQDTNDEFLLPAALAGYAGMKDGDAIIMANFRADRAREILEALIDPTFKGFARGQTVRFSAVLGMCEYSTHLATLMPSLFPPQALTHIFGEIISHAGLKQLRIAETEKYAHVTFFFNGGREELFPGEERILIPSPNVATYDLKPEMSAFEVTEAIENAIAKDQFDVIVVNYANGDMVGHTGDTQAAIKAAEAVDQCIGRLVTAALGKGGALFITADHGNAEMMFDHDTKQAHTAHTLNLVPAIVVAERFKSAGFNLPEGRLGDVAPTLLQLLRLPQPAEMTGRSLLPPDA